MLKLFDFLFFKPEEIDRFEKSNLIVDTCSNNDAEQPYETAISHPKFNSGKWIVVEEYDDKETAKIGHDKWVLKMTRKVLPEMLIDMSTCDTAKLFKGKTVFVREGRIEN